MLPCEYAGTILRYNGFNVNSYLNDCSDNMSPILNNEVTASAMNSTGKDTKHEYGREDITFPPIVLYRMESPRVHETLCDGWECTARRSHVNNNLERGRHVEDLT